LDKFHLHSTKFLLNFLQEILRHISSFNAQKKLLLNNLVKKLKDKYLIHKFGEFKMKDREVSAQFHFQNILTFEWKNLLFNCESMSKDFPF